MDLLNGYKLPDISGEFSGYSGHPDKSCRLSVMPTGGILKKDKKRRNRKSLRELISLGVWNQLLDYHTTDNMSIHAPIPYGRDKKGSVFMEFLQGVSGDNLLNNNEQDVGNALVHDDVVFDFSLRVGRILRIKDIERLSHGDFQLRHLIYDLNQKELGVIDVENSISDASKTKKESDLIKGQMRAIFHRDRNYEQAVNDGIEQGYQSEIGTDPILTGILDQVCQDLDVHRKQVSRLFER